MENIESVMQVTMSEIKKIADVNTIVGDAITAVDGSTIVPVSKVSLGFVSGGGEYGKISGEDKKHPFGGGGGAGITITPMCFLAVGKDGVCLHGIDKTCKIEAVMEKIPKVVGEFMKMASGEKEN